MEECHRMLTDQVDLVNPEGHRLLPDVSKPLPLGGPPGQVTIQPQFFFNKDLEYLVSGDKGRKSALSISKLKAAQYLDFGLEELWFKRKEFYITKHNAPSDRSKVRSHMQILSVVSLKTLERYGYAYLKEIVLHRADYKEYKISEADFKNLHPNDFEDLYLLHLQEDLQLKVESYQTKLNLTQPDWDDSDFLFKEDYTIVSKPKAVIYRDMNDLKKMIRETEVHKFSDGTLNRILDKLDYMVKDFKLYEYNLGIATRIWSKDDRRRSKLVPSCFVIFDLEPLSFSFDFVFCSKIFKSLSLFVFNMPPKRTSTSAAPAMTQATIRQLCRLVPSCFVIFDLEPLSLSLDFIQRISLTGFPAQSIGSSNTDVLDLPCLLVLITGTSQSRQHESRKSPTAELFDVDTGRISIRHCEY
ncbi:hypothetical protein Tco_0117446 [Tanacetum coccineum]